MAGTSVRGIGSAQPGRVPQTGLSYARRSERRWLNSRAITASTIVALAGALGLQMLMGVDVVHADVVTDATGSSCSLAGGAVTYGIDGGCNQYASVASVCVENCTSWGQIAITAGSGYANGGAVGVTGYGNASGYVAATGEGNSTGTELAVSGVAGDAYACGGPQPEAVDGGAITGLGSRPGNASTCSGIVSIP